VFVFNNTDAPLQEEGHTVRSHRQVTLSGHTPLRKQGSKCNEKIIWAKRKDERPQIGSSASLQVSRVSSGNLEWMNMLILDSHPLVCVCVCVCVTIKLKQVCRLEEVVV